MVVKNETVPQYQTIWGSWGPVVKSECTRVCLDGQTPLNTIVYPVWTNWGKMKKRMDYLFSLHVYHGDLVECVRHHMRFTHFCIRFHRCFCQVLNMIKITLWLHKHKQKLRHCGFWRTCHGFLQVSPHDLYAISPLADVNPPLYPPW